MIGTFRFRKNTNAAWGNCICRASAPKSLAERVKAQVRQVSVCRCRLSLSGDFGLGPSQYLLDPKRRSKRQTCCRTFRSSPLHNSSWQASCAWPSGPDSSPGIVPDRVLAGSRQPNADPEACPIHAQRGACRWRQAPSVSGPGKGARRSDAGGVRGYANCAVSPGKPEVRKFWAVAGHLFFGGTAYPCAIEGAAPDGPATEDLHVGDRSDPGWAQTRHAPGLPR